MGVFLFALLVVFLLGLSALWFIGNNLPPLDSSGNLLTANLVYFFLALFASLAAGLSLVLYCLSFVLERKKAETLTRSERAKFLIRKALRRGLELAATGCLLFLLKLLGIFNPVNAVLIVLIISLIEVYFVSNKS
ncbi:MAG: hypothetical protein Q8P13_00255 [bacterium]|nr:hypothetical protein [bacterium]